MSNVLITNETMIGSGRTANVPTCATPTRERFRSLDVRAKTLGAKRHHFRAQSGHAVHDRFVRLDEGFQAAGSSSKKASMSERSAACSTPELF